MLVGATVMVVENSSMSHTYSSKNYSSAPAIKEETSKPKLDRAVSVFYDRVSLPPLTPVVY